MKLPRRSRVRVPHIQRWITSVATRPALARSSSTTRDMVSDKLLSDSSPVSIPPERPLMQQLDYNLLYRWFVGLGVDNAA